LNHIDLFTFGQVEELKNKKYYLRTNRVVVRVGVVTSLVGINRVVTRLVNNGRVVTRLVG